jgi:hypothetical protein
MRAVPAPAGARHDHEQRQGHVWDAVGVPRRSGGHRIAPRIRRAIRDAYKAGGVGLSGEAARFGVSVETVRRCAWRHRKRAAGATCQDTGGKWIRPKWTGLHFRREAEREEGLAFSIRPISHPQSPSCPIPRSRFALPPLRRLPLVRRASS